MGEFWLLGVEMDVVTSRISLVATASEKCT